MIFNAWISSWRWENQDPDLPTTYRLLHPHSSSRFYPKSTNLIIILMAIIYALVARGSVVLAEFSVTPTNASSISRQILDKIPGNDDSHVSYSQDRYIFHVKRTDGLTVLCMADDTAGSEYHSLSSYEIFICSLVSENCVCYTWCVVQLSCLMQIIE